ncbi:hypothetical protein QTP88_028872 [Uroleucon formosanum]
MSKNQDRYKHKSGCEKRKRILEHELQKAGNKPKQTKLTVLFKTSTSEVETKITPANQINLEKSNNSESIECFQNIENLIRIHDDPIKISQPSDHHKISYYSIDNETKSFDDSDSDNSNSNFTSSKNCSLTTMNANLGLFIAPNENETLVVKMDFIKKHPVQPTPDLHNLPFDFSRVYFRSINNGTEHKVHRKWLSFDNVSSKIYCSVCMTFGKNRDSVFVKGIDINLKSIYIKINKHEESNVHNEAVSTYLRLDSGKSVKALIHIQRSKEVQENCLVMLRIIYIILTLAKQDIAFRGHSFESAFNLQQSENLIQNQGNFLALIKLVAKYDSILLNRVQKSSLKSESLRKSRNEKANSISKKSGRGSLLTFLSKTTVNKIVIIIGNLISASIAEDVITAKVFSLEVDSTQDISVTDQLSIFVRYVLNGEIYERLIKMCAQHDSTGKSQYDLIKAELNSLGIDLKNLISNSFDGAVNMSGQYKGLQNILKEDAPKSIYTHCYAHVLNLVISDTTLSVLNAQNVFNILQKTAVFFSYFYKRSDLWKRIVSSQDGNEKLRRLKKIRTTRWNSKHHALQEIFHTTSTPNNNRYRYINLIEALYLLGYYEAVDSNMASDARNLLEKWTNFEIILTSFIFLHIFEASTPVSAYLQTKNLDYIAAWNHISSLQEKMEKLATNFAEIYQKAKKKKRMDGELAIEELPTRISPVTNYKVTTFIPIMDQIKSNIQKRFSKCEDLMKSLAYLDPKAFYGDNHLLKRLTNLANVNHEKFIIELKDFAASYESLYLTINADLKKEKLYEVKKLSENDEDLKNQDEEDNFNSSNSVKCIKVSNSLLMSIT